MGCEGHYYSLSRDLSRRGDRHRLLHTRYLTMKATYTNVWLGDKGVTKGQELG